MILELLAQSKAIRGFHTPNLASRKFFPLDTSQLAAGFFIDSFQAVMYTHIH